MPLTRLGSCVRCGSPRGAKVFYCTRVPIGADVETAREDTKEFAKIVCNRCLQRHVLTYGTATVGFLLLATVAAVFSGALIVKGDPAITWITVGLIGVLFAATGAVLVWRHCLHAGSSIVIHFLQKSDEHPSPYHYVLGKGRVVLRSPKKAAEVAAIAAAARAATTKAPPAKSPPANGDEPVASL